MQIKCPYNNIPEREYAIRMLFDNLLGVDLAETDICFDDSVHDYHISVGEKQIIVQDHFFQRFPEPLSYINKANIPDEVRYFHALGMTIPMVYGVDEYYETEHCITIGLDIFASTFFMLTRWEESLLGRDEKGDCQESQLFAVRNTIHCRPLVHEYEQLLRKLLEGCGISFQERQYKVILAHDVDGILTPTYAEIVRTFFDHKKNGLPQNTVRDLTWKSKYHYKKAFPTAYSQFQFYTMLAKKYGIPEWFYFKVCASGENEATYCYNDRKVQQVVSRLYGQHDPNIVLGFHPSQSTINNESQWDAESQRIVSLLGTTPTVGRNHHLLYNLPMLRLWEQSFSSPSEPFHISNCLFHARQGFRTGTSVPFPLFDYYQRRQMNLIEHPNQIMDTVIRFNYDKCAEGERWMSEDRIIDSVRENKGELVLTWHIYIRLKNLIEKEYDWCERVLEYAMKQ